MQPRSLEATCEYKNSADSGGRGDRGPVAFAPAPASAVAPSPAAELEALLRKRLRFAAFLFYGLSLAWQSWVYLAKERLTTVDVFLLGHLALVFLVAALVTRTLGKRGPFSVGRLRALEAVLFAAVLTRNLARVLWYTPAESFWSHAFGLLESGQNELARVLLGGVTAGFLMPWLILIIVYGVLIPNTGRRCALVVGTLALTALLIWAGIGLWAGVPARLWLDVFWLYPSLTLATVAALSAYASHRIDQYRRQAWEARKLGQYQLKRLLGKGGMGEVYLAEHVLLRRPCAVKLIRPERAGDAATLARFEREVRLTAALTHPNTVQVFDYGRSADGTFYYAMEYLPGPTLEELVRRDGPLPGPRAIHFLRQVCGALGEAHRVGLIHRDIKPSNVMVCERGGIPDVAKLLDFGLVRAQAVSAAEGNLTQEGGIPGTPAYMSPEQAAGREDLDGRSDIYSLGAVAYYLLTGRPPFAERSAVQMLAAHLYEAPAPPTTHRPDLPAALQEVVLRCLAKNPAERFANVYALIDEFDACCIGRQRSVGAAAGGRSAQSGTEGEGNPAEQPDIQAGRTRFMASMSIGRTAESEEFLLPHA
jgi:tRNA A-37 threonylcarbamoyl transferase component Bud32